MVLFLKKIFGTAQSRKLGKYFKLVDRINEIEKEYQKLTDSELRAKTEEFRQRLKNGASLNSLLPEAFAVVKNTCRRLIGTEINVSGYHQKWDMVPYDVQLVGGMAMHFGSIAEMQTGEGKTLTAAMPLYLNALTSEPVHLVTVNDYLAKRDCQWIGEIFRWLGLSVQALTNDTPAHQRRDVYKADIVYGTSSEFGFDYLRDNSMAQSKEEQCQRGHFFAIVDEVDSILIDEARTPLIISGPAPMSYQMYDELKDPVSYVIRLQKDLCNKIATNSRKILEAFNLLSDQEERKLTKQEEQEKNEALRQLWIVSKGNPQNKVLKRVREIPPLRAALDQWETFYYSDQNKEARQEALADLYIVVNERANEYELTDKGIHTWMAFDKSATNNDFVMLDLGEEYSHIDADLSLTEEERMNRKVLVREEDAKRKERSHNLRQMFRAHLLMERDVDYIISEGKIVIIDENTGRPQPGRRFSDGLHQAIEAKENVPIQGETQTYATITLQNYFRLYKKLAGMTGTAITEAQEFKEIYKLDVLVIPTHRPCLRADADDEIYMTEREKYTAILKDIKTQHEKGRSILIGTESVEESEKLARILKQNKLPHTVLNAKNHEQEAEIIAEAGAAGAITVATNMAGRGTDIKLKENVAKSGGLHVIGTTRHQSRRIDRQLRGRSARQGDPGSSKFYISFEDSLMRLFTSPKVTAFLQRFRPPEGEPISAKVLNKSIETAQKRVEQRNSAIRKHTLEYDDVMNKQRSEVYSFRNEVLHAENTIEIAEDILDSLVCQMAQNYFSSTTDSNPKLFLEWLMVNFPIAFDETEIDIDHFELEQVEEWVSKKIIDSFRKKLELEVHNVMQLQQSISQDTPLADPTNILKEIIRNILIRSIDKLWQEHLLHIDHLRTEVNLRSIGQKDPLQEFKHEAFALFKEFSLNVKTEIAHSLFKFMLVRPQKTPVLPELEKPVLVSKTTAPSFKMDLSLLPEE